MAPTITNRDRGKVFNNVRGLIPSGGGSVTNRHIMRADLETHIVMSKNAETATIEITTDTTDENDDALTDLENADIIWVFKSTGTGDYDKGGTKGITGVRIISNPVSSDVDYYISQTK